MTKLISTLEAARLTGVAPSSVKRWADQGVLPCVRTAGGHRRYDRRAIERFIRLRSMAGGEDEAVVDPWLERLVEARRHEVEGALLEARARLGAWHRVADEVGAVLTALGQRWEAGRITIADEHLAADCLGRALARIAEALPGRVDGPPCLLACAEGDEHTLGLSLAEVCLRELGWVPLWLGRRTPSDELVGLVHAGRARMVALSASAASSDASRLAAIVERIGAACRERGAALVLGGSGAWPAPPRYGVRLRSFGDFHAHLTGLEAVRGVSAS